MKQRSPENVTLTITLTREDYDRLRRSLRLAIQMADGGFNSLTQAELILARAMAEHEKEGK